VLANREFPCLQLDSGAVVECCISANASHAYRDPLMSLLCSTSVDYLQAIFFLFFFFFFRDGMDTLLVGTYQRQRRLLLLTMGWSSPAPSFLFKEKAREGEDPYIQSNVQTVYDTGKMQRT
jgi:hypothetical protein